MGRLRRLGLTWLSLVWLDPASPGLSPARPSPDLVSLVLGLAPLSSACFYPAHLDSPWLGLAWPGLSQAGGAWLGPRRSGDSCNLFLQFFRKFRINRTLPYCIPMWRHILVSNTHKHTNPCPRVGVHEWLGVFEADVCICKLRIYPCMPWI